MYNQMIQESLGDILVSHIFGLIKWILKWSFIFVMTTYVLYTPVRLFEWFLNLFDATTTGFFALLMYIFGLLDCIVLTTWFWLANIMAIGIMGAISFFGLYYFILPAITTNGKIFGYAVPFYKDIQACFDSWRTTKSQDTG